MRDKSLTMSKWTDTEAKKFLRAIGIKKDQFVVDFGCGDGSYSIPASLVVGNKGKVYSVDKNKEALLDLKQKIRKKGLLNVEILKKEDDTNLLISKNSIDIVLLYDVLHLIKNRKKLFMELYRVLKKNGILSLYPKHHDTEMNMTLDEVISEIEDSGFNLHKKLLKKLMHSGSLEKGYVFNFKKTDLER